MKMGRDNSQLVVDCLTRIGQGDETSANRLFSLVYDELRALAADFMKSERLDHTLQPTALVHEAYLRIIEQQSVDWKGRAHFFAIAAQMIRRVLIDHSRGRNAVKRGGHDARTSLVDTIDMHAGNDLDLLSLNNALERLAELSPRQAKVVELRFFGGLTNEEVAHVLDVSRKTVVQDWAVARAWISRELSRDNT